MMRVFVCDDDKDILELMEMLLNESGHIVMATEYCDADILKSIEDFNPDIMIFDYWLNGIKSDKIIKNIRKNKKIKKIPIILISAAADLEKIVKNIPVDDYMKKPFDINDLLYKVKHTIHYA